jgi:arylsulfatase
VLGTNGYRTHAIVTNPFLTAYFGMDDGFCTFENVTMEGEACRALARTTLMRSAAAFGYHPCATDRADVVARRATDWLDDARADGHRPPFFLWLHFLDPHAPYGDQPSSSTSLVYDLLAFQKKRERMLREPFSNVALVRAGEYRPSSAERKRIRDMYEADVAYLDREVMRLLDKIEELQSERNVLVVLTADHGEEFWDHGGTEHGQQLFEEVVRVPLVIAGSGAWMHQSRENALTVVQDLLPTIVGAAGIDPVGWSGRNLLDPSFGPSDVEVSLSSDLFGAVWTGTRTERYVHMTSEFGEEHVYDLRSDPAQQRNIAGCQTRTLADTVPR